MGRLLTPVDNLPQLPGHAHPDLAAFGQIPADHAVPVPVASPPPAGARVGEVRVHARLVAQARAAGEPGAVVVRDADARAGRQRREHRRLRPDAFPGGLAGHDPGHEEPGLPLDLGARVASGADHAVGLPMAETAAVAGLRRTLGDGNPSGNRETRRPPAATPAPPPATTGVRMTGGGACVVWRACGRPCAARGRRCSSGPSSDASAGTAVRTRSRWTGTTCRV